MKGGRHETRPIRLRRPDAVRRSAGPVQPLDLTRTHGRRLGLEARRAGTGTSADGVAISGNDRFGYFTLPGLYGRPAREADALDFWIVCEFWRRVTPYLVRVFYKQYSHEEETMKSRRGVVVGLSLSAILLAIAGYAAVTTILAVGTIADSEVFDGPATMTVRQMIIAPGEALPWHYHPGIGFTAVKRGTLTLEEGCGGTQTLLAGQAFEELHGHIHRARNVTSEEVEVYNTFVVPQGSPTTVNTPDNQRLCGPPTTAADCKSGGWTTFTFPRTFINQGDCEQYVITGN